MSLTLWSCQCHVYSIIWGDAKLFLSQLGGSQGLPPFLQQLVQGQAAPGAGLSSLPPFLQALASSGSQQQLPFVPPFLSGASSGSTNSLPPWLQGWFTRHDSLVNFKIWLLKASLAWPPLVERTRILRLMWPPQRRSSTLPWWTLGINSSFSLADKSNSEDVFTISCRLSTSRLATAAATTTTAIQAILTPLTILATTLATTLATLATPHTTLDTTLSPLLFCLPTVATILDMLTILMQQMSDILTDNLWGENHWNTIWTVLKRLKCWQGIFIIKWSKT